MGLIRAALYMLAQSCGAVLGAGILWSFTTNEVFTFGADTNNHPFDNENLTTNKVQFVVPIFADNFGDNP